MAAVREGQIMALMILDRNSESVELHHNPKIIYVLEGSVVVTKKGSRWVLKAGEFLSINPDERFSCVFDEQGLVGVIEIDYPKNADYLDLDRYEIVCSSFDRDESRIRSTSRLIRRVFSYFIGQEEENSALLNAGFYELAYILRTEYREKKKLSVTAQKHGDEAVLEQIQAYLNTHYKEQITLKDLSEETYFSTSYISRYIKQKFGKNFTTYLTEIRLNHAIREVEKTEETFIKVATGNGFPNTVSFNRAFKETYGVTPSVYRKRYRREHAEELGENSEAADQKLNDKIRKFFEKNQDEYSAEMIDVQKLVAEEGKDERLHPFWNRMINCGFASSLLTAEMQAHLVKVKNELGIRYIRFWDIWSPELMIIRQDSRESYNFSRLDTIITFLYSNQMYPYIDLGFKPAQLMKDIHSTMRYESRERIFRSADEYGEFIDSLLKHYIRLCGYEYVSRWILEQWADLDADSYEDYISMFYTAKREVRRVSPGTRIGGAGLSRESKGSVSKLISTWSRFPEALPDFISVYLYPFDDGLFNNSDKEDYFSAFGNRFVDAGQHLPFLRIYGRSDYTVRFLENIHALLRENGMDSIPLHLSEWNFTFVNRDSINDSTFKGAYIVKSLIEMLGKVDIAGYWIASDLFSEYYDTGHLVNGSGGILTKDGICKPAYYGFLLFGRMDSYVMAQDANSLITTNRKGGYQIICHNYEHPAPEYYEMYRTGELNPDPERTRTFFDHQPRKLRFVIRGVKNGTYLVKTRLLDEEHGSVQDEWKKMGYTDELNLQDLEYLKRICIPHISISSIEVTNNVIELETELQSNAIENIHLFRKL